MQDINVEEYFKLLNDLRGQYNIDKASIESVMQIGMQLGFGKAEIAHTLDNVQNSYDVRQILFWLHCKGCSHLLVADFRSLMLHYGVSISERQSNMVFQR